MKKLRDLLNFISYLEIKGSIESDFSSVVYNSQKVTANSLFVAIRGTTVDGHNYISEAISRGSIIIVCEEYPELMPENITFIKVSNARKSLAEVSNFWFDFPAENIKFIGVTGTNGKTTTCFLIHSFLKWYDKKSAVIGTTGIYFGDKKIPATHTTPESLELFEIIRKIADTGIEYVVMEVSSHSLVQMRVHGINFKVAVFTNLTHDHLDYHKTLDNYADAKKILFNNLSEDTIAIVNSDDPFGRMMLTDCISDKKILISREKTGPEFNSESKFVLIESEEISIEGIKFTLRFEETSKLKIAAGLIGKFNIDNLTYAVIAAKSLGFGIAKLPEYLDFLQGAEGRMESVKLPNGAIGIIDYAHTPDALEKALMTISELRMQNYEIKTKIVCVFGCGGDRDKAKRPLMGKIAGKIADFVLITSDNPRKENPLEIINDIYSGIDDKEKNKTIIEADRRKAISLAYSISKPKDIILIAGKGHEDYQIIGNEKYFFKDKDELLKIAETN